MMASEVRFTEKYLTERNVLGSVIEGVQVDDGDGTLEFPLACLVVRRPDGTRALLWIHRDPEGNGPGWLDVQNIPATMEDA